MARADQARALLGRDVNEAERIAELGCDGHAASVDRLEDELGARAGGCLRLDRYRHMQFAAILQLDNLLRDRVGRVTAQAMAWALGPQDAQARTNPRLGALATAHIFISSEFVDGLLGEPSARLGWRRREDNFDAAVVGAALGRHVVRDGTFLAEAG